MRAACRISAWQAIAGMNLCIFTAALANASAFRDDSVSMAKCIQHTTRHRVFTQALICILCAFALAFPIPFEAYGAASPSQDLSQAQTKYESAEAALAAAEEKLAAISEEYNALSDEVDSLQAKIDGLAQQVLDAQANMLNGRSVMANTAVYEYRSSSISTFLSSLLGAQSWNELSRNVDYVDKIMDQQSEEIERQKELKAEFMQASDQLTAQKNAQDAKLEVLNSKRSEATEVVEEAAAYVDESSEKLADLKQQAEQFIWKSKEPEAEVDVSADTVDREEVMPPSTPVIPDPSPGPSSGEYMTGVASAYGGSSDPYTPNPGRCADGVSWCTDTSMGVAVPMSLPNYKSYFGRTVEITYNGMTVYATVNDCGYMGGGSRALDLQPGVFKAFGFGDCYAWGVRTVKYRFL